MNEIAGSATTLPVARVHRLTRRHAMDTLARWVVWAGGFATIASIVAILLFIGVEVYPLLLPPQASSASTVTLAAGDRLLAPATDEYREVLSLITENGMVRIHALSNGAVVQELPIPGATGHPIAVAVRAGTDRVFAASTDGQLIGARLVLEGKREGGQRMLRPRLEPIGVWPLTAAGSSPTLLAASVPGDSGVVTVFAEPAEAPALFAVTETQNLFGVVQRTEVRRPLALPADTHTTALALTANGRRAFVGTANGWVQYWDITNPEDPRLVDTVDATGVRDVAVTALSLLIGDQSLVVGDASGNVSVWFAVRDAARAGGWRLQRVHVFAAHRSPVTAIAPSPRDKGFLTADTSGEVRLHHATTERTLLTLTSPGPIAGLAFSPKANGALVVHANATATSWDISNPHPDASLGALFGKTWYEGYEQPEFVWQSTGGTDDFEPKYSLIPLIIGTIKGTLYALLFAVPIAVASAIYTSQFMHPTLRNLVKPLVEIMAALPSVVLGFLAGLWLAPVMEGIVPALLAMAVVLPVLVMGVGMVWGSVPAGLRLRVRPGTELVILIPIILLGVQLCLWANGWIENTVFDGNFRHWLLQTAGFRFDQRNCLVVGFAMGFAVIPIIFTISEDSLSSVPQRLISGSLALGATRWQTAMRVVFPTASPGIFSATMIGIGRAVGETMIVLMATGNTPVLDFNIFTGMRTLSANIAVEIPEAPFGSTLYRVLFLAALLLFMSTFLVNTAAELVRMRLRRRYQQL